MEYHRSSRARSRSRDKEESRRHHRDDKRKKRSTSRERKGSSKHRERSSSRTRSPSRSRRKDIVSESAKKILTTTLKSKSVSGSKRSENDKKENNKSSSDRRESSKRKDSDSKSSSKRSLETSDDTGNHVSKKARFEEKQETNGKNKKDDESKNEISKENNQDKINEKQDDDNYDEAELKDIESFLIGNDDNETPILGIDLEEKKQSEEEKLKIERKKRLEAITKKYTSTNKNSTKDETNFQIPNSKENKPTDELEKLEGKNDELDGSLHTRSGSVQSVTRENLSKLAIEDHQQHDEKNNTKILLHSSRNKSLTEGVQVETRRDEMREKEDEGLRLEVEKTAVAEEEKLKYGDKQFAFDIFSASPSDLENKHLIGLKSGKKALREALLEGENPHLQSNWDDGEGYYKARIGELIGDRFQILGVVGKGVFSTVLKCLDKTVVIKEDDEEKERSIKREKQNVAVKMIRNNDTMRKAAEKEKAILLTILDKDPANKKYIVKLLTHLEYRNHVALVFEFQAMNLRETLKKFGKDVGINIGAVRMYGRQLMIALRYLSELRIVHADIKLDNILCSGDLKQIKLCDFGSAFFETDTDNDPTPYLVSRFYRAPEIILGMPYDRAIDLWSVAVSLYELFTGHVMFPGRTNNEMLKLMMGAKGRFPNKQLKSHIRAYEVMSLEPHFDADLRFKQYEMDPISGKTILRLIDVNHPTKDVATSLRGAKAGADDTQAVNLLADLLEKGLSLDPTKRISSSDALRHPFFNTKG